MREEVNMLHKLWTFVKSLFKSKKKLIYQNKGNTKVNQKNMKVKGNFSQNINSNNKE